jgi:putative PIN family toxin of toxin-antitoxin system
MRVVFDTNILVLSLLGDPATAILQAAFTGVPVKSLAFYYSEATLGEYQNVLGPEGITAKDPLIYHPKRTANLLSQVRDLGHLVHPTIALDLCSHEPDNRFLECAVTADADYLVTVNTRHFPPSYGGVEIVPPHHFYNLLFSD